MRTYLITFMAIVAVGSISAVIGQNPAQLEDANAERLKILRAADQIEVVQHQLESTQSQFTALKNEVASLRSQLESGKAEADRLRSDIVTLKTALEKIEAARAQEREVLLKEIGALVADKLKAATPPAPTHVAPEKTEEKPTSKPAKGTASEKPEKGVYHTVESGQTLVSIVQAYRENGFNVTLAEVRAANQLSKKDTIRVGQKLFIPKK